MDRIASQGSAGGSAGSGSVAQRSLSEIVSDTWAQARYDLRLSEREFWRLTPRLFHMLWDRHRSALIHREQLQAWTTAAVINFSAWPPEKAIAETVFMPSRRTEVEPEPEGEPIAKEEMDNFRSTVANLAALVERYQATGVADPQLVALGWVAANG